MLVVSKGAETGNKAYVREATLKQDKYGRASVEGIQPGEDLEGHLESVKVDPSSTRYADRFGADRNHAPGGMGEVSESLGKRFLRVHATPHFL